jgi:hypothetical protein
LAGCATEAHANRVTLTNSASKSQAIKKKLVFHHEGDAKNTKVLDVYFVHQFVGCVSCKGTKAQESQMTAMSGP